jgi:hypothetical protein
MRLIEGSLQATSAFSSQSQGQCFVPAVPFYTYRSHTHTPTRTHIQVKKGEKNNKVLLLAS